MAPFNSVVVSGMRPRAIKTYRVPSGSCTRCHPLRLLPDMPLFFRAQVAPPSVDLNTPPGFTGLPIPEVPKLVTYTVRRSGGLFGSTITCVVGPRSGPQDCHCMPASSVRQTPPTKYCAKEVLNIFRRGRSCAPLQTDHARFFTSGSNASQ